jgi:hypothetical protein
MSSFMHHCRTASALNGPRCAASRAMYSSSGSGGRRSANVLAKSARSSAMVASDLPFRCRPRRRRTDFRGVGNRALAGLYRLRSVSWGGNRFRIRAIRWRRATLVRNTSRSRLWPCRVRHRLRHLDHSDRDDPADRLGGLARCVVVLRPVDPCRRRCGHLLHQQLTGKIRCATRRWCCRSRRQGELRTCRRRQPSRSGHVAPVCCSISRFS